MITYLKGDATSPQSKGPKVIVHVCNDAGKWGAGFVLAVSSRWPAPEASYREWYKVGRLDGMQLQNPTKGRILSTTGDFGLGEAQLVQVLPDTYVVNMVAQAGTKTGSKGPPIRYDALEKALGKAKHFAGLLGASVHMPRIGCALAGGRWSVVEPVVQKALSGFPVFVYDFGAYNP
jgi:O-acetyl-ADP-ribose deacetylase (regulator of RNase III)